MGKDKRTGWVADLKVGDTVIIATSNYNPSKSKTNTTYNFKKVVQKITPTGIMTIANNDGSIPYRVSPEGVISNSAFIKKFIVEMTKENLAKMVKDQTSLRSLKEIKSFNDWDEMDNTALNTIASVISGWKKEQKTLKGND